MSVPPHYVFDWVMNQDDEAAPANTSDRDASVWRRHHLKFKIGRDRLRGGHRRGRKHRKDGDSEPAWDVSHC